MLIRVDSKTNLTQLVLYVQGGTYSFGSGRQDIGPLFLRGDIFGTEVGHGKL